MDAFTLAQQIGEKLRARHWTLAVAESCTGGLLGDRITDVPGSSDYFLGGVLAYNNQVKHNLLGVRQETLETVGAVSAPCAAEMAQGVRRLLHADVALSITGIAGPSGDTASKPLGLTYIHLSAPGREQGQRAVWPADRRANKEDSAAAAMQLLLDYLEQA